MNDPKRWLDDPENAPDGAPDLLRHGEKKPPALSNAIKAASAVALANAAIGTASASLGVTAKVIALVLVVGAGGGAAVVAKRMSDSSEATTNARRTSNEAELRRVVPRAQPVPLPVLPPAMPTAEVVEPPPEVPEQNAFATTDETDETDETRVVPARPRTPMPRRAEPIMPPAVTAVPEVEVSLVEEATRLEQARGALRSDPARALSIADAHARRYPNASLRAETELIAIDALVRLGRYAEARARGEAALRTDDRSLYSSRIRRILERANEP